jgi:hypothetical protein
MVPSTIPPCREATGADNNGFLLHHSLYSGPKFLSQQPFFNWEDKDMGIFATEEDEKNAYRTSEGMIGRSIRRGTDKAINAITFGLVKSSHPINELSTDAAQELLTKVIPRSLEKD